MKSRKRKFDDCNWICSSSVIIFQFPLFRVGSGNSSSRFILHTSWSSTTSFISLRLSPKRFHPRPSMWLSHLSLGRPTGLLPLGMADRACFGSLSWGILLTWPNHLSCDLSRRRSSDSTFRELWISELYSPYIYITIWISCAFFFFSETIVTTIKYLWN